VKRAKPLEPILLGRPSAGHILPEPWRREPETPEDQQPLQETDPLPELGNALGDHALCGGAVTRHRTAVDWTAVVCVRCFVRYEVPKGVNTWADLRTYLYTGLPQP
jgi:hypothetical protein